MLLFAWGAGSGTLEAQNLIFNPGFEQPAYPGTSTSIQDTGLPGWTITGANELAEVQRRQDGVVAVEGQQYIELDTTGNTTIYQDVPTVQGPGTFRMNSPTMKIASHQAPLRTPGSMESLGLIADEVRRCESARVDILCCPEGILGGLAP